MAEAFRAEASRKLTAQHGPEYLAQHHERLLFEMRAIAPNLPPTLDRKEGSARKPKLFSAKPSPTAQSVDPAMKRRLADHANRSVPAKVDHLNRLVLAKKRGKRNPAQ